MPLSPFLGQLMPFAGNFAPRGWALCAGQLLPISQNTALFSLIGTYYGGNGVNTFALPDLRGRTPIHQGNGAGLSPYVVGEMGGVEAVTLSLSQLGTHNHPMPALATPATAAAPTNAALAQAHGSGRGGGFAIYRYTTATASLTSLSPQSIASSGSQGPHNNLQPYLTITWCIALQGIYPTRN
jgi:microcystin-dependent protein